MNNYSTENLPPNPPEDAIIAKENPDMNSEINIDNFEDIKDAMQSEVEEEKLIAWKELTGLDDDSLSAAIEAFIFLSDRPLTLTKIRDSIHPLLPLKIVYETFQVLQQRYEDKAHGIRLVEVAEGVHFRTKATLSAILKENVKNPVQPLSPATMEVLAIICYRGPITKTKIEVIRGVDSSHLIRTLLERRLVQISGRSEDEPGRPTIYETTREFLEYFNLNSKDDLPTYQELEELAQVEAVRSIPKIKEVIDREGQEKFKFDDLEELDKLSQSLKDIPIGTEFTKLLMPEKEKNMSKGLEGMTSFANITDGQELEKNNIMGLPLPPIVKKTPFELLDDYLKNTTLNESAVVEEGSIASSNEFSNGTIISVENDNIPSDLDHLIDAAFDRLNAIDHVINKNFEDEKEVKENDEHGIKE